MEISKQLFSDQFSDQFLGIDRTDPQYKKFCKDRFKNFANLTLLNGDDPLSAETESAPTSTLKIRSDQDVSPIFLQFLDCVWKSESEDDSEEEVTLVELANKNLWFCHDPDCDRFCRKKQDLKFHIMGDARGGHGARFDPNHPLRWRKGVLFIEHGWDPYIWKCDHCDDYNGFCKGYVNRGSLIKHFKKVHPELPLPEKRQKMPPSRKRKRRRLEGGSVLNVNYEIQL